MPWYCEISWTPIENPLGLVLMLGIPFLPMAIVFALDIWQGLKGNKGGG